MSAPSPPCPTPYPIPTPTLPPQPPVANRLNNMSRPHSGSGRGRGYAQFHHADENQNMNTAGFSSADGPRSDSLPAKPSVALSKGSAHRTHGNTQAPSIVFTQGDEDEPIIKSDLVRNRALISIPCAKSPGEPHAPLSYTIGTSPNASEHAPPPAPRDGQGTRSYVLVNYLYQLAIQKAYVVPEDQSQGVVLKVSRAEFECCPAQMRERPSSLHAAVSAMNVRCAMTIKTSLTATLLETIQSSKMTFVPLPGGLRIQVLRSMDDLPRCQLHHFAAFVEKEQMLVVWEDEPEDLIKRADHIEVSLVKGIWDVGEENLDAVENMRNRDDDSLDLNDVEACKPEERRVMLLSAIATSVTCCLVMVCVAFGWRKIAIEIATTQHLMRLGLAIIFPVQIFVSMFFFIALVGNLLQIFGPTQHVKSNSKYFSGMRPKRRLQRNKDFLPHVTIQIPVYREGLEAVIRPTVLSVKAAISTYEMQGGTANIFINDDGMQLLSPEQAQARREFYEEHQIGWVARPGHGTISQPGQKPFWRRGKFKKASNMNCSLHVSTMVEKKLQTLDECRRSHSEVCAAAYRKALSEVLHETGDKFWAEGNIRLGDYILLIDSDTRIPKDCFMDAVTEMEQSPQVAVLQFSSGVMRVSDSVFESGMHWFTDLIYHAITYAVASGDAPPFVGHNAMLRWQAIQSASVFFDPVDGYDKIWSEGHVSEDFAMALGLQSAGYTLRYASYTQEEFQEGVSLTVYDELARWEKYSYGCNEIIFHPFGKWLTRSPFTPIFRQYITCGTIPVSHKITVLAYMGTYYALAAAFPLVLANYFLTGWEWGVYDKFYLDSFACFMSVVTVFTGLGNISLAVMRSRLKKGDLLTNLMTNAKWIPMFTIYLGGVSLHLWQSIMCHFFGIDMTWGTTSKEVEDVIFGKEIVRILKQFKTTFVICGLTLGTIIYFALFSPWQWQIVHLASIFPLGVLLASHILLPLSLSPTLMRMSW